ncbi:MAG: MFS transporter [Deltaproteobacteria bacterium]|nr:MFS transporter [Deltaproteobacteria bacterium]
MTKTEPPPETSPPKTSPPEGILSRFLVLRSAPRELWLVYYGKVMETVAYALCNMGLMLYLINDLQFSDQGAGTFVGIWATAFSLATFLVGSLSDALGIRKTLIFSFGACIVFRTLSALIGDPLLSPVLGLMPMAFAAAMTLPVMVAATRRFTSKEQSSMGFALLYVFMNIGFAISGKVFDWVRATMGKDGTFTMPIIGAELSVYETIFLLSACFTLGGLLPLFLGLREGAEMPDEGDTVVIHPVKTSSSGALETLREVLRETGRILTEVFREPNFYRFLLFLSLVVGVRLVFYHMHYTLAPYADRELGYGSRFGTAWGVLNPLMIIVLTPIVGAVAQKVSSYKMIVVGTSFCALSCFMLVLPNDTFIGLAGSWVEGGLKWFLAIDGDFGSLYYNLIVFAFLFSIGEAIWTPRLYEYTATVAPKGRESTYMGLSMLPLFFGKLIAGPMSGVLLGRYCPVDGVRRSSSLWLVVTLMAVASPVSILLLKNVVKPRETSMESDRSDKSDKSDKSKGGAA